LPKECYGNSLSGLGLNTQLFDCAADDGLLQHKCIALILSEDLQDVPLPHIPKTAQRYPLLIYDLTLKEDAAATLFGFCEM